MKRPAARAATASTVAVTDLRRRPWSTTGAITIRVADLTMPWTFRGGGTRRDIYRSMSTGFYGTPMPGFHNNLGATPEESQKRMWAIVDYMLSLSGGPRDDGETPYLNQVRSVPYDDAIEIEKVAMRCSPRRRPPPFRSSARSSSRGAISTHRRWRSPRRRSTTKPISLSVVTWHDMSAETGGGNAPDLPAPKWDEYLAETGQAAGG